MFEAHVRAEEVQQPSASCTGEGGGCWRASALHTPHLRSQCMSDRGHAVGLSSTYCV